MEGEGQPPRPADLRTVNVMSWCPFAGALFHMEVALFQEQQQQSQVQPATMPRFKYTGRIQVTSTQTREQGRCGAHRD